MPTLPSLARRDAVTATPDVLTRDQFAYNRGYGVDAGHDPKHGERTSAESARHHLREVARATGDYFAAIENGSVGAPTACGAPTTERGE